MQNITQPAPKQAPQAQTHGTCRLTTLDDRPLAAGGIALLTIRPTKGQWADYWVQAEIQDSRIVGYRLEKLTSHPEDKTAVYLVDVSFGGWEWAKCDCPDAKYRGQGCKHIRTLKAVGLKA